MRSSAAKTEMAELATRDGMRTLSCDHLVIGMIAMCNHLVVNMIPMCNHLFFDMIAMYNHLVGGGFLSQYDCNGQSM